MIIKHLHRKRATFAVLFTLLLSVAGVTKTEAQELTEVSKNALMQHGQQKSVTPTLVSTIPSNRNVIIETFTGRSCGYDPDAHRIANQLAAANPDRVWPINVHVNGSYSPTTYPNLNTQVGSGIAHGFNCNAWPTGVVNRSTANVTI